MKNVNYVKEINSFRKYAFDNYLSSNAVLLWYGLFGANNDLHWQEWFKIDNLRLMGYAFIKREATLIKARQELIDLGLIKFKKGSKGHPSQYSLVLFSEQQQNNTYPNYENEVADSTDNVKPDTENNNTENNNTEQNNTEQPAVSNDNFTTAAADKRPYFYYYKPKKATNNYKQYNPRDRNRFNNFEQRNIDINELERMLLANNLASLV